MAAQSAKKSPNMVTLFGTHIFHCGNSSVVLQCDKMVRLFFQYLSDYNIEILPNSELVWPKSV